MRYFYIIVLMSLNYSCSQKNTEQVAIIQDDKKIVDDEVIEKSENTEEVLELSGQIKKVQFRNKAGRLIEGVYDVYFVHQDEELFIKFFEGNVLRTDIDEYLGKNLTVKASIKEGLLDTNDENIQSRIGKYIVLYEIVE